MKDLSYYVENLGPLPDAEEEFNSAEEQKNEAADNTSCSVHYNFRGQSPVLIELPIWWNGRHTSLKN
jgi:hypothetical protein